MKSKYLLLIGLIILSISLISSQEIKERGSNFDIYKVDTGLKKVIYPSTVNVPYNGNYIPVEDFITVSDDKGKVKFSDLNGNNCWLELDYNLKVAQSISPEINIVKQRGSYYFTTDVKEAVNSMNYVVNCSRTRFENNKLFLNDIVVDFDQAEREQNISTRYNSITKKLEFDIIHPS